MDRSGTRTDNIITLKGVFWLLFFVFYLQFCVAELAKINWSFISSNEINGYVLIILVQIFAVALPTLLFLFLNSAKPSEIFELKKLSEYNVFICAVIGIALQPVASVCNTVFCKLISKTGVCLPQGHMPLADGFGKTLLVIVSVALLPSVFEEFLMRGVVFYSFKNMGYRNSIFITSFLFALLHNDISSFLGTFLLGVILCYAVWTTGSVFASVIIHFSFNLCGIGVEYIISRYSGVFPWLNGFTFWILLTLFCILILSLSTTAIIDRSVSRTKSYYFLKNLSFTIFNLPIFLIIVGFIVFTYF